MPPKNELSPYAWLRRVAFERDLAAFQAKLAARVAAPGADDGGQNRLDTVSCEACAGIGWVELVEGGRRMRRCDCWKIHAPAAVGVDQRFSDARFKNYDEHAGNRAAIRAAKVWFAADEGDQCFCGPIGTGKTRLVSSALNEIHLAQRGSTLFLNMPRFMLLQRQAFDDPTRKRAANDATDAAITADFLCVDDVAGGEQKHQYSHDTLLGIYEHRLAKKKRTLWTSNVDLQQLASKDIFGDDRLTSRIAGELPGGNAVVISGEDVRLKMARAGGRAPSSRGLTVVRPDRLSEDESG